MFPQKASEDKTAAKRHQGHSKWQVHEWNATKSDREEYQRDCDDQTGHFQTDHSALRRATQTHIRAGNQGG